MIRRPPRSTRTTHSFPTRRSSDLHCRRAAIRFSTLALAGRPVRSRQQCGPFGRGELAARQRLRARQRSEEHTSELQSLVRISYAVFCLKKKKSQRVV